MTDSEPDDKSDSVSKVEDAEPGSSLSSDEIEKQAVITSDSDEYQVRLETESDFEISEDAQTTIKEIFNPSKTEDIFEKFIDEFEQESYDVSKFEQADSIIDSFGTGLGAVIVTGFIWWLVNPTNIPYVSTYLRLPSYFGVGLIWYILSSAAALCIFGAGIFAKIRGEYPVSSFDITQHYLAMAVESFEEGEYEDCIDHLGDYQEDLSMYGSAESVLTSKRRAQVRNYYKKVSELTNPEEALEDTFEEFFTEICASILAEVKEERLWDIIEEIEVSDSPKTATKWDILSDALEPITSSGAKKVVYLVGLVGLALVVAYYLSASWAIVLLSACTVYLGLFD